MERSVLCLPGLPSFDKKYPNSDIVKYYYNLKYMFSILILYIFLYNLFLSWQSWIFKVFRLSQLCHMDYFYDVQLPSWALNVVVALLSMQSSQIKYKIFLCMRSETEWSARLGQNKHKIWWKCLSCWVLPVNASGYVSNLPQHTWLEVSSIPSKTLISCFRVCLIRVGAKLCRPPALQDRTWWPLFYMNEISWGGNRMCNSILDPCIRS